MYEIILSPLAVKRYKRIGTKEQPKADRKIESLSNNPFIGKALSGEYKGRFSLRAWPLRIIYTIDREAQTVTIITINYRGSVYKN
ncbi:hypothetical protein A3A63_03335 [Candidatus Gottesmanbacteria bacterium RIFCSPLOWO2_01_FULL_46_9]|uniref:Addiction module toxin RelE n=1 Tax=Candidatus Gottesmanbacteria bacterium RIFCSPLOWO2_01_FULL_46_9 TaxID=1798394 RepID=A0A1F6AYA9_9BACT|nr:MAG: hypothetical protein A3A63_03335 [Candidatus Gottesmanbacteria bacterium RIFCSPLOWO2_01_FULL_46_9]